ncbi:putative alcohol dehydrogenase [Cadophora sp. MPI-SDFR-AT-0126]|nr:putative alcohol dehydrogenase [Leotiomycetes sp. MPI-SDFR-AT-0126]
MSSSAWQIRPTPSQSWRSLSALENLYLNTSVPVPSADELGPETVLVRIRAAALNARDAIVVAHAPSHSRLLHKSKNHRVTESPPPRRDGAGEVFATGPNSKWKVGDRVFICPLSWDDEETQGVPTLEQAKPKGAGNVQGTLRTWAVLADNELLPAPPHLTFEEVAALPCAAGTAMNALMFGPLKMKPGMTVLTMGTGGVSCAAIQLASALGCTVISTSSSDSKLSQALSLGATHTINYTSTPDWDEEVLHLTDGKGVDHVLDVGGSATLEKSLRAVRRGGLVSCIGFLGETKTTVSGDGESMMQGDEVGQLVMSVIGGAKIIRGIYGIYKTHCKALLELVNKYEIHPLIAEVFEFGDAKMAFERIMRREVVGKVVVRV